MILHKETKKLYLNKYQHKIVLVLPGARLLRGTNLNRSYDRILYYRKNTLDPNNFAQYHRPTIDYDLLLNIVDMLRDVDDFSIRVERCYLSIYLKEPKYIEWFKKIAGNYVKEIYSPKTALTEGTIVSSLLYDYKVYIYVDRNTDYEGFINWATDNKNLRVPKSTMSALRHRNYICLGSLTVYFYITGDKNLTMAKMHLGTGIKWLERIINP